MGSWIALERDVTLPRLRSPTLLLWLLLLVMLLLMWQELEDARREADEYQAEHEEVAAELDSLRTACRWVGEGELLPARLVRHFIWFWW